MLHEFIASHRTEIIDRTKEKLLAKSGPQPTDAELSKGIPLFLEQLIEALRAGSLSSAAIDRTAVEHGSNLLRTGSSVSDVVHDYGGVCQAITDLAVASETPINAKDFNVLNRCLDDAIAHAVVEFTRQREQSISDQGVERLGMLTHELRNLLNTAALAFEALQTGSVAAKGSTSKLLDHSLQGMRRLIDRSLAEVRLEAGLRRAEHVSIGELVEESAVAGAIEASRRGLGFLVAPVENDVAVKADRQHLAAAIANLLQNAFKFTLPSHTVSLRTHATADRVFIEIADGCGGLPAGKVDELFGLFTQRGGDRSGLGLGLAISRQAVEESGGEIHVSDVPGTGCVFAIDLPRERPSARR